MVLPRSPVESRPSAVIDPGSHRQPPTLAALPPRPARPSCSALGLIWRSLGVRRRWTARSRAAARAPAALMNVATRQGRTLDRDEEGRNAPKGRRSTGPLIGKA